MNQMEKTVLFALLLLLDTVTIGLVVIPLLGGELEGSHEAVHSIQIIVANLRPS